MSIVGLKGFFCASEDATDSLLSLKSNSIIVYFRFCLISLFFFFDGLQIIFFGNDMVAFIKDIRFV